MAYLNEKIVAYLAVNNIAFDFGDYETGIPFGETDQILHWNIEKLGAQPTVDQLSTAYTTYQSNIVSAEQSAAATKSSALAKLTALGLTSDEIKAITGA